MHVRLVVGIVGQGVAGELRLAVTQLLVEQIELQFERHHRVNAFAPQAFQHLRQHFAGFEFDGFFGAVGGDQHLPDRLRFPGHRLEGARYQAPHRVRVAVVEAVVADFEQPALHPQQHAVLRQLEGTAGRHFFEHLDRVALAVEMPGNVQGDEVDVAHLRVALAESTYFSQQVGTGSVHHQSFLCCYQV
ncbi:hypothetical protein D3C84_583260 [compost metagenome]